MGNTNSAQPPAPSPPVESVTLPLQRVPTTEGGSGLHYSGAVYLNQATPLSSGSSGSGGGPVCSDTDTVTVAQIADVFPGGGVSSSSLQEDPATHRISQQAVASHVEMLIGQGKIPGQLGGKEFSKQVTADKAFYAAVQSEFCFYEARYRVALGQFLESVAAGSATDATTTTALNQTIALNRRLNSLLEVINYVGNERARNVNARSAEIDRANATIQERLAALTEQKQFLQKSDVTTRTYAEMVRFSAEKNRAMTNQILLFVGLNVIALGTVLTVARM